MRIGRDAGAELVVDDPRIAPRHAHLAYRAGEWLLAAEGSCPVRVNGTPAPVLPLRSGDLVALTPWGDPRPLCLRFENRMEGAFFPEAAGIAAAWLGFLSAAPSPVPSERLAAAIAAGRRSVADPEGGPRLLVDVLGPARDPDDVDRHLRLLLALAGAAHPSIAHVLDGGIAPTPAGPVRWIALRDEPGEPLDRLLARGPLPLRGAVSVLRSAAGAVAHLHRRGVAGVLLAPENLRVSERAALLARVDGAGPAQPEAVRGDLAALAGLAAVLLGGNRRLPDPIDEFLPGPEGAAPAGLSDAATFERRLAFAEAAIAVGSVT
jgi:hypothetical protein